MALTFNPPTDLINAYMNRPNPGLQIVDAANQAMRTYAVEKDAQQKEKLAQQQKDIEMAKGLAASGQDFTDAYKQVVAARTAPPAGGGSSLIDRAKAFFGGQQKPTGSPLVPSSSMPPQMSTGTVSGMQSVPPVSPAMAPLSSPAAPMTTGALSDPMVQEYQKNPIAFRKQHGSEGIAKLSTQVGIDKNLNPKPEDKYYTTDQASKLLKNNPDALAAIGSFEKDKIPRDAVHLLMTQQQSGASGNNVTFIGNDPNGKPLFADKHGKITQGEVPSGGSVLPKSSTLATSSTRSSAEFANTIIPHIQDMRQLVSQADQKGFMGPAAGRIYGEFLAGKVGSTGNPEADQLLGQLRATDSLLKTGALRIHFGARGGTQMYDHFSELLNSGKQSAAMLNGSLDALESFMRGYSNAGKAGGNSPPPPANSGLIHLSTKELQDLRKKMTAHQSNGD